MLFFAVKNVSCTIFALNTLRSISIDFGFSYFVYFVFSSKMAKIDSRRICLVAFTVTNFLVSLMCVPLTGSLPRTEVLEVVSSNQPASPQQNGTQREVKGNGTNICMTKGCVKASALILDLIDENVNPCENFYEFACGKFLRNTLIPVS